MPTTELAPVDTAIYHAADQAYDALRAASLRVPGLITAAIERGDRTATADLAKRLRDIEKSAARLREMLYPTADVSDPLPSTVEEWA